MEAIPAFITLMLDTQALKKIKKQIQEDGKSFSDIEIVFYRDACEEIKYELERMLNKNPALRQNKEIALNGCETKTFQKIFCPTPEDMDKPNEKRRRKILSSLLLYAQVEQDRWNEYLIPIRPDKLTPLEAALLGYWYVYRMEYDNRKVPILKRTILHVSEKEFGGIKASFQSLPTYFKYGEVNENGQLLTFYFKEKDNSIEISINRNDDEFTLEKSIVSNGLARATNAPHYPFAKHCVMVHAKNQLQKFNKNEIRIVRHSSHVNYELEAGDENFKDVSSADEDAILVYLNQQGRTLVAQPFVPASIDGVLKENKASSNGFEKFATKFLAYIPYAYEDGISLSQIVLDIDILGRVTETVFYKETEVNSKIEKIELVYQGHAVILSDTLRLSNENELAQKSQYLFKINLSRHTPEMIQGVTLDTDNNGYPCADACIAIRADVVNEVLKSDAKKNLPVETRIIRKGTAEYDKLDKFLISRIKISIEDYFFKYYRSIRYKKRDD